MRAIIKLLRPHQYLKNGFVLIGPLFASQWDASTLIQVTISFLAFCAMASAVYVLNDLLDIESDRVHPVKRNRPLPSGTVSPRFAKGLFVGLVVISILLAVQVSQWVMAFVVIYLVINLFYSWRLKHVVILDVFLISSGFMLRILTGTVGLGIAPSSWLLLCGLMVTLFLGFAKRRAELMMIQFANSESSGNSSRKVLDDYSAEILDQFLAVTAACTVISYGLYTVSSQTVELHGDTNLIYTLPFVIYGIFRYVFLLHQKSRGNDTAKDLVTDPHLLITGLGWFATTLWALS